MEKKREAARRRLHFCVALIGGWFGAYMILRFGHYASAVTVNFLELFTGIAQGRWAQALLRLGSAAVYTAAIVLALCLSQKRDRDLRRWAIYLDMAAAAALCCLPETAECGVYASLFAMAFQWSVFSGERGYPCSTVFSTNNLRQFVDACVRFRRQGGAAEQERIRLYGGTLLFFHAGAAAVCLLWGLGCGRWSILGALLPAVPALFWQGRSAE